MAMNEEWVQQTSKNVPPRYMQEFYGGAGAGVPGVMPMVNQAMVNRFATMGVPGATPYTYGGMRVAPFSGMEQAGFNLGAQGVGSYMPYFSAAERGMRQGVGTAQRGQGQMEDLFGRGIGATQQTVGQGLGLLGQVPGMAQNLYSQSLQGYNPQSVGNYMNPYTQNVVDTTLGRMREQTDQQKQGARDRAVGMGAFGGSRSRLNQGEIERAGQRAMGEVAGGLYGQGYQQAQAAAMGESGLQRELAQRAGTGLSGIYGNVAGGVGALGSQLANVYGGYGRDLQRGGLGLGQFQGATGGQLAGLGTQAYGMMGQDIGRLMQMGGMQRGMQQRLADVDYGNFTGQYNLPYQTLGQTVGMTQPLLGGLGGMQDTSRYRTSGGSDSLMDLIGTGLSAYGAYKSWGNS